VNVYAMFFAAFRHLYALGVDAACTGSRVSSMVRAIFFCHPVSTFSHKHLPETGEFHQEPILIYASTVI
jgi:hypothetical protein